MKKGQYSLEFLFVVGITFLLFIGLLILYLDKNSEVKTTSKSFNAQSDCNKISNLLVYSYITESKITTSIKNSFSLYNKTQTISIDPITCSISFASFVSGNFTSGTTTFEMLGGSIHVHQP